MIRLEFSKQMLMPLDTLQIMFSCIQISSFVFFFFRIYLVTKSYVVVSKRQTLVYTLQLCPSQNGRHSKLKNNIFTLKDFLIL